VHVLHEDLPGDVRDRVQGSIPDHVRIEWVDARPVVAELELPRKVARPMYFRLVMAELLPTELDRVIYLDADVIVRRSLRDLWQADVGVAPIGAVRDAYLPWMVRNSRFHWRDVGVAPDAPFFNSGVLVVDLERWRAREVGSRALGLLSRESSMFDQCALNVVLEREWSALSPEWNVQSYHFSGDDCLAFASEGRDRLDAALSDPAIVHFTDGTFNRPWEAPCRNPYRDEWLTNLDRTAWRGWRPEPSPALARAWGRMKRALRVMRYGGSGDVRSGAPDA
jgi:lipopolysaccharide biosynthesis glycosyltransferase